MHWHDNLTSEQLDAVQHLGSHACLLAGPGTGKTLVMSKRIVRLIREEGIDLRRIVGITFTRAAAFELRRRVEEQLGDKNVPRISTLHSFALRQLLRNARLAIDLPQPVRIADDWEERNVILEDLKTLLQDDIAGVRNRLIQMSADWHTLAADASNWAAEYPDGPFLGAWMDHRSVYGYTLRAELVYQLRKAMQQHAEFSLELPIDFLLVDEYQDLNKCDLDVIKSIASFGAEVFAAGDDEQSIYGFRLAYPLGIRSFSKTTKEPRY